MEPTANFFIRPNRAERLRIAGDREMFRRILADLLQNAGPHAPSEHWLWVNDSRPRADQPGLAGPSFEEAFTSYFAKFARLDQLMDPWVGCTDMKALDPVRYRKYEDWCAALDV